MYAGMYEAVMRIYACNIDTTARCDCLCACVQVFNVLLKDTWIKLNQRVIEKKRSTDFRTEYVRVLIAVVDVVAKATFFLQNFIIQCYLNKFSIYYEPNSLYFYHRILLIDVFFYHYIKVIQNFSFLFTEERKKSISQIDSIAPRMSKPYHKLSLS